MFVEVVDGYDKNHRFIGFIVNNNYISNDNVIIELLGISFKEYYMRLRKHFTVKVVSETICILKKNLTNEEIAKKFENEFVAELTILKMKEVMSCGN